MDYTASSPFLQAADLHNLGAGNESFFSDPVGNTGDFISKIPAFAISSVASGINSIYNSAVVAGNFFGVTDAKEADLQEVLGSYDSDLGKYYSEHKQSTDLVGFVATSFVPGIAGVKLFNTGQRALSGALKTGSVGKSYAEATGLIRTVTAEGKTLTQIAAESLAGGQQSFTLMNVGVVKAIASGVAQATLESAAFEAMVQATMFRSPILAQQDFKDIGSNILTGALLGGAIGGTLNAAGVYGGIKKALTAADLEAKPFTLRSSNYGLEKDPQARLMLVANDLEHTPIAATPQHEVLRTQRITDLQQEQRIAINQLAGKDTEIAGIVANTFADASPDTIVKGLQGAREITRPGYILNPGEGRVVGYVKLHGEGLGETTFDALRPGVLTLADKLPNKQAIDNYIASAKFSETKEFSIVTAASLDEISVRYIWADKVAKYKAGMKVGEDDLPLLEGALKNNIAVNVVDTEGGTVLYQAGDLLEYVRKRKLDLADELGSKKGWNFNVGAGKNSTVDTVTSDDIARALNVSPKFLESEEGAAMFVRQDAQAKYTEMLAAKKLKTGEQDLDYIPQHAAVIYDTALLPDASSNAVSALVNIKQQQAIQKAATDRAVASITGELFERFVEPGEQAMLGANRYGAGAGLVTFSNGGYGTLASWSETVGKATAELQASLKVVTSESIDSAVLRVRANKQAAIEVDKIRNILSSTTERYVLSKDGDSLVSAKWAEYSAKIKAGEKNVEVPSLQSGAPTEIKFINEDAAELWRTHIGRNGDRVTQTKQLKAAIGLEDSKQADTAYAWKPNPRDMPHFAFVKDETVTGAGMGHTSMLHAATAEELESLIKMTRERTNFTVYTKQDNENFFKAEQQFEFGRTLHENYIDSALKSAGVNNQFFPKTNPDSIAEEFLKWHARQDDILARETVSAKFGHEFDQLETLGQQYTNIAGSRYATSAKTVENTAQNPYNDYKKTALNISRLGEYPLLSAFNTNLEKAVSTVVQRVRDVWDEAKSVNDLQKVNDALQSAGINHAYKNAAEIVLANHTAPKAYVSQFIRSANSILANTFLRLDPLNALNNAIGAQVLLGHETSLLLKGIRKGNPETAGELAKLASITVPGVEDSIMSTSKLIGNANVNWFKMMNGQSGLVETYKRNGWLTNISEQYKSMLDDLAVSGTETPIKLNSKLEAALVKAKALTDKGERITGNRLVEEYNRFVAADVARQITDVGVKAGVLDASAQATYINTFVNRTQGNALASQRPLIFQGPVGQAIGLFQSFQFNTLQQLFRGVAEGGAKDAAMLVGLQGTLYGMNGLPAFQYINQHIVGTASGNKDHTDAYSLLYGSAGKTAGDWLMYGIPSNFLQTNIYSRGDINPRNLTVVPVNPADIVAVSAFAKFAGNIKETFGKIAGGGDVWQSFLQGVEHNGLSRPLAGLAQTLQAVTSPGHQVYSTTNAGDISFVNDLFSMATISRLAGGKPLDEALVNDQVSRSIVYKAADKLRMKAATEAFKTTVIGNKSAELNEVDVHNYMEAFVKHGGTQPEFNKNMLNALSRANTPRANQVIATMKGSYSESMKNLMGGSVQELDQ